MEVAGQMAEAAPDVESDERSIWEWCRQGDAEAFGLVVQKYMKQAYYTALGFVGNHEDALDLSQEAFVRAYKARLRFDPGQKFFTWYYRILRNLCLNHLRNQAKFTELPEENASAVEESGEAMFRVAADPSVLAERNELTGALWNAISALKPEDREIIVLRELDGCAYAEIAERLEIPVGTVMSRLYYARHRLRQSMEARL